MSQPRTTVLTGSITIDMIVGDHEPASRCAAFRRLPAPAIPRYLDDPESPLGLLVLADVPRMGEDGGGNDAPPAGKDGEDGGGNDAPPAKESSDGEDGGGNDAPPVKEDAPPAERIGRGEDGGGNDAPPADAGVAGPDGIAVPLSRAGHLRAYEVLPEKWMPGGDLVTPTMKIRRRAVPQQRADHVGALHACR